jgi:transcriptional regulator with XRE-family HTH domain
MNIGETLKKLRKRRGLSQQEVSEKSNISRTYISLIEKGECNPSIELLESIGKVLCIPFPIISFMSFDINSIPENRRETYRNLEPAINNMIEEYFQKENEPCT